MADSLRDAKLSIKRRNPQAARTRQANKKAPTLVQEKLLHPAAWRFREGLFLLDKTGALVCSNEAAEEQIHVPDVHGLPGPRKAALPPSVARGQVFLLPRNGAKAAGDSDGLSP